MYSKFNYSPSDYFYNNEINPYLTHGNEIYSKHEKEVQECLSEYISEEGVINGTALKEHWFSITPKNVFISHNRTVLEALGGGIGSGIGFIGIGGCLPVIRHPSDPREAAGGLDGVGSAGDGDIGAIRADIGDPGVGGPVGGESRHA